MKDWGLFMVLPKKCWNLFQAFCFRWWTCFHTVYSETLLLLKQLTIDLLSINSK